MNEYSSERMDEHIDILIAKVLAGEADDTERAEIEKWKDAHPDNRRYYDVMARIFDEAPSADQLDAFNTDHAWQNVKPRVQTLTINRHTDDRRPRSSAYDFLRIAAMLFLVTGIGFAVYKVLLPAKVEPVQLTSGDAVREARLPDQTNVTLNRNSTLAYTFTESKRKVEVKGEAYFDLAPDAARPFEVIAHNVVIRDIGTAFNVKAPEGNDSLTVYVTEGEIIMTTKSNKSIVLRKGEEALYLKSRDELIRSAVADTNATAYKTKIFVFENAALEVVVSKLNEVYNSRIMLSPSLHGCRLTATFRNESPEAILEIIAETLQLTVTRTNDSVILTGSGCNE